MCNRALYYYTDLEIIPYESAWRLQKRLVTARKNALLDNNVLLFLEHPAVFTMGRRGGRSNLSVSDGFLEKSGIKLIDVERGGDITYHGPGQLIAYPIVRLGEAGLGIVDFVTQLEEVMIRTVGDWGIQSGRNPKNRGIWIGEDKLGSIGIAVRRGISFHGLALNVSPDMTPFNWITPCGLPGVKMTRMADHAPAVPMGDVKKAMQHHWENVFQIKLRKIPPEMLTQYH